MRPRQGRPGLWWNPLSYVTVEVRASNLADVFTAAAREPGARTDAYFDPRGLEDRELTQVYLWLTRPTDDEPAQILREHGYPPHAASVDEAVNMAEKQRGGVYGTARKIVALQGCDLEMALDYCADRRSNEPRGQRRLCASVRVCAPSGGR